MVASSSARSAVGQLDCQGLGEGLQVDFSEQLHHLVVQLAQAAFGFPEMEGVAHLLLQRYTHVFQHAHVAKYCGNLERAHQAEPGDLVGLHRGDVLAAIEDFATGGREEFGEQIEYGGLAGAVGADKRMDVTLTDLQIDGIHCGEAAEFLGQAARFQHELWFLWVPSNLVCCCWLWRRSLHDLYVNDNNQFPYTASGFFKRVIER